MEISLLATVTTTFLLAGVIKGVIGLGLPSISLALLTVAIDLPSAMVLLLVPSFITNLWQAVVGGNGRVIVSKIWPFLLLATTTVWVGAIGLNHIHLSGLSTLLGALLIGYSIISLAGYRMSISRVGQVWTGPAFGAANGILTGMTGSFVVPGVMYLQGIGLSRSELIQAMGILFTLSTISLAAALGQNDLLSRDLALTSLIGVLPAVLGMIIGQKIRPGLSEQLFRRVFFIALLCLGLYIVFNASFAIT